MAVTNPYYEFTPSFVPGTTVRAAEVNAQFAAVQTAFDFLPSASDALTTGTATFAPESGSGNSYVVTMPDTRTSNQDGDEIIFFAAHSNTGAATLNVDGIGAVTMTDRTGAALASGDITSGRLYIATYDASNTRFVLDVTTNVVTNIIDKVQGTSTDDPTSPGTFNALLEFENASAARLGDVGYNTDTDLSITNKVHGGSIVLAVEDVSGVAQTRIKTGLDGETSIYGDGDTPSDEIELRFRTRNSTQKGRIGYLGSNDLVISNIQPGGAVILQADDLGDTPRTILDGDPDNDTFLYAAGVEALGLRGDGTDVVIRTEANVGLTADVGSSQGDGVITSSYNVYSTVGTAGDAATLPATFNVGTQIFIKNDAAVNSMDVFPASGDDAGAGTNTAVAVAAGDFAVFIATAVNATWTKLLGGTA